MDLTIGPVLSQKNLSVVIPQIDFIFGDERRVVRDCDLIVQILISFSVIRIRFPRKP